MRKLLSFAILAALVLTGCGKDKEPPVPVITIGTQPTAPTAALVEGNISGSLTIAATATEGASPTYQWYSNTSASSTSGTKLDGATSATYALPATLTEGTYYYFCEVGAKGAVSVRSAVVTVTVGAKPASVPVITIGTQPASPGELTEGSIPANTRLTVAATVTQDATPAYQWYAYDPAKQGDAAFTKIDGATSASYTLPTTLTVGDHWYVCEVSAEGAESVQTDPVKVTVVEKPVVVPPLVIDPAANYELPAMTIGTAITPLDVSGAASGGTKPYTYSATGLPAGLTIAPATGIISGKPTTAQDAGTATITVTDSSSPAKTATISVKYGKVSAGSTPPPPPTFVAVSNISGVPTAATVGTPLTLTATVAPSGATNKIITWDVVSGSATIVGNVLTASAAGPIVVKATIANGATASTPYTQNFPITATAADSTPPTVLGVTPNGTGVALSGNVVITFNEAMHATQGTVKLNGTTTLTGGSWTSTTVYTIPYSGLDNDVEYTVNIAGFKDAAGNTMVGNDSNTFTSVALGASILIPGGTLTVTAPATGATPATTATITTGTGFNVSGVTWSGALDGGGNFKAGTVYHAVIKLTPETGYEFKNSGDYDILAWKLNTTITAGTKVKAGDTLTLTFTFPILLGDDDIPYPGIE